MKFNLNKHTWLGYPVFAVLFIVTSLNILLASQDQFRDLFAKQNQVKTVEEQVENLRAKVRDLESVDLQTAGMDLELLSSAVPPSREVWSMILGIRQAVTNSALTLSSYRVSVGEVRVASSSATPSEDRDAVLKISAAIEVSELIDVVTFSKQLNNIMPLLRVASIRYVPGKADFVIEGAWSPWGTTVTDVNGTLPDYEAVVNEVKPQVVGLTNAATLSVGVGEEAEAPVSTTGLF